MVEPEVVATSPNRIKSPVPVCCGFDSVHASLDLKSQISDLKSEVGARGRTRTCTGDALDVVSLLLDYASSALRANCRWQIANSRRKRRILLGICYWLSAIAPKALDPPAGAAPAGILYKRNPQAAAGRQKWSQSPVLPRARLAYDACLNAGSTAVLAHGHHSETGAPIRSCTELFRLPSEPLTMLWGR